MALSSSVPSIATAPTAKSGMASSLLPKQQHAILKKIGFTGPVNTNSMNQFMQSTPGAASLVLKLTKAAKGIKNLNAGGSVSGYSKGNLVRKEYSNTDGFKFSTNFSIESGNTTDGSQVVGTMSDGRSLRKIGDEYKILSADGNRWEGAFANLEEAAIASGYTKPKYLAENVRTLSNGVKLYTFEGRTYNGAEWSNLNSNPAADIEAINTQKDVKYVKQYKLNSAGQVEMKAIVEGSEEINDPNTGLPYVKVEEIPQAEAVQTVREDKPYTGAFRVADGFDVSTGELKEGNTYGYVAGGGTLSKNFAKGTYEILDVNKKVVKSFGNLEDARSYADPSYTKPVAVDTPVISSAANTAAASTAATPVDTATAATTNTTAANASTGENLGLGVAQAKTGDGSITTGASSGTSTYSQGNSNTLSTGNETSMAATTSGTSDPEDIYGGTIAAPVATNLVEQPDQVLSSTPVTADTVAETNIAKVGTSEKIADADKLTASTYTAGTSIGGVTEALKDVTAVKGEVSEDAKVKAVTGELSEDAKAKGVKFDQDKIDKVEAGTREVDDKELAVAAGQDEVAVKTQVAQADTPEKIKAAQAEVKANEIAKAAEIKESDMASATAIASGGLSDDATAVAAKLAKFTVADETLAEFVKGSIEAEDTVQGQLAMLMKDFDNGTPVWAAGAMRAANAAMAARGLGSSSMAGAAIVQAAMESAIPIASQDAQTFANMNMTNVNNRQKVALTNAAAQQGVQISNFNAEQQTALQNSQNAFSLQSQDLSNVQAVLLANAQIKASLQGQNLSNRQQANLAEAARYAEVSNLNLNNRQQALLQDSANSVQVDLANLSARQQAYVANAQLEAALQGKKIDNRQQTAINNSARYAEANNLTFTAAQQAQIHNSKLMESIGLAELSSEQAAVLQNAASVATMDLANLNNLQQAAVQNAKAFLQMDLANLNNEQTTMIFKAQAIQQSLLQDVAQENAAKQFNASSQNQTDQFMADLKANIDKYNLGQSNDLKKYDAGSINATRQFNTTQNNSFKQFNTSNSLLVAQANAAWRQSMATTNNETANENARFVAKEKNLLTVAALDEIWQRKRDEIDYIFSAYESDQDRTMQIVLANMLENATINAATFKAELDADATLISWGLDWLEEKIKGKVSEEED